MPSRSVDRQPEGRWIVLLFLALLPVSPGWQAPQGEVARSPLPALQPADGDSLLVWAFLAPAVRETWSIPATLRDRGASIRVRSRWLGAVSISIPGELTAELEGLPGVRSVRPVARVARQRRAPVAGLDAVVRASSPQEEDSIYGELFPALSALGIPQTHALGFEGTGVRVGILDGAFRLSHAAFRGASVLATRDFVDGDPSVEADPGDPSDAASHGSALWALTGGELEEGYRGAAPGVGFLLARVREATPLRRIDEDRWVAGLEWLESLGARIVLSGINFRDFQGSSYTLDDLNGNSAPSTLAADEAARRGVLVVVPVGNDGPGPRTLGAPADGDSVLSVGGVDSRGLVTVFTSLGPTADGRPKPDLLAPATALAAASGLGDQVVERVEGTEFAAALLAGGAALMVEAYPDRGPMEILEILRRSVPPDTGAFSGVPRFGSGLLFPEGVRALPMEEVDGDSRVTSLTPQIMWDAPVLHPLGLPVTFRLEFAEDSVFRRVVVTDSTVGTFARRLQSPLPAETRLFWRVEARSVQGVVRSSQIQGPIAVPPWVTLDVLDDPGGTEVPDAQPEFKWSAMPIAAPAGPFVFHLEVLSDREGDVIQEYLGLEDTRFRVPSPLPFNQPMRWRIIAETKTGAVDTTTSAGPFVVTSRTKPPVTALYQNYPNPFPNRELGLFETRIWFDLADSGPVHLAVYDIRGRLVRSLIPAPGCDEVVLEAGSYGRDDGPSSDPCVSVQWDGRDDRRDTVPPGVYLLRLRSRGVVEVRRMVFWP